MEKIVLSCLESRIEENQSVYSRFLLGPFISGHAVTVATALRRALLSEVKNIAITALHIQGITHEFSTVIGVRESVLELSLNFQQIILYNQTRPRSDQVGYLHVQGPAIVYANDLKLPDGIECVNPTQYIATLSTEGFLAVKFLIGEKRSCLESNTSALTMKKIKQAKRYSAQLSKTLLRHTESDLPRLFGTRYFENFQNRLDEVQVTRLACSKLGLQQESACNKTEECPDSDLLLTSDNSYSARVPGSSKALLSKREALVRRIWLRKASLTSGSRAREASVRGSGRLDFATRSEQKLGAALVLRRGASKTKPALHSDINSRVWLDFARVGEADQSRNMTTVDSNSTRSDSNLDQSGEPISRFANEFNSELCLRAIIPLDPIFNPVYQVNFAVEKDDLSNQVRERVIMEVWTNGSIHPRQAIHEAALSTMSIFSKLRKTFQLDSHSSCLWSPELLNSSFAHVQNLPPLFKKGKQVQVNREQPLLRQLAVMRATNNSLAFPTSLPGSSRARARVTAGLCFSSRGRLSPRSYPSLPEERGGIVVPLPLKEGSAFQARVLTPKGFRFRGASKTLFKRLRTQAAEPGDNSLAFPTSVAGSSKARVLGCSHFAYPRRRPVKLCCSVYKLCFSKSCSPLKGVSDSLTELRSRNLAKVECANSSKGVKVVKRLALKGLLALLKERTPKCNRKYVRVTGHPFTKSRRCIDFLSFLSFARSASQNQAAKPGSLYTEPSRTKFDLSNSVRPKLNSFSTLGFIRLRHPVALFIQKFAKSQIQGQTFLLEQSFGLKARFFKGQRGLSVASRLSGAKSSREENTGRTVLPSFRVLLIATLPSLTLAQLNKESGPQTPFQTSYKSDATRSERGSCFKKPVLTRREASDRLFAARPDLKASSADKRVWCSRSPTFCASSSLAFSTSDNSLAFSSSDNSRRARVLGFNRPHSSGLLAREARVPTELELGSSWSKAEPYKTVGFVRAAEPFKGPAAEPRAAEPRAAEPRAAEPRAAEPRAAEPRAAEPRAAEPRAAEPRAAEPRAAEPRAAEPRAAEPRAAEPRAAEPRAAEPRAAEPRAAEPRAAEPYSTVLSIPLSRSKQKFMLPHSDASRYGSAKNATVLMARKETKPILFLMNYRTFSFTRNALRIFGCKQEDSSFLLPIAKQLIRSKVARVINSCVTLISKRSEVSLGFATQSEQTQSKGSFLTTVTRSDGLKASRFEIRSDANSSQARVSGSARLSVRTHTFLRGKLFKKLESGLVLLAPRRKTKAPTLRDTIKKRFGFFHFACNGGEPFLTARAQERWMERMCVNITFQTKKALFTVSSLGVREVPPLCLPSGFVTLLSSKEYSVSKSFRLLVSDLLTNKNSRIARVTTALYVNRASEQPRIRLIWRSLVTAFSSRLNLNKELPLVEKASECAKHYPPLFKRLPSVTQLSPRVKRGRRTSPFPFLRERGSFYIANPVCSGFTQTEVKLRFSCRLKPSSLLSQDNKTYPSLTLAPFKSERDRFCTLAFDSNPNSSVALIKTQPLLSKSEPYKTVGFVRAAEPAEKEEKPRLWLWPASEARVLQLSKAGLLDQLKKRARLKNESRLGFSSPRLEKPSPRFVQAGSRREASVGIAESSSAFQASVLSTSSRVNSKEFYKVVSRRIIKQDRVTQQLFHKSLQEHDNLSLVRRRRLNKSEPRPCSRFASSADLSLRVSSDGSARSKPFFSVTTEERLSVLYPSNLDKMSFLLSDLANLSLSLKTYTFLKKKGKKNIANILEYSPKNLLYFLNGDEKMFYEIERSLLFLGLTLKEEGELNAESLT